MTWTNKNWGNGFFRPTTTQQHLVIESVSKILHFRKSLFRIFFKKFKSLGKNPSRCVPYLGYFFHHIWKKYVLLLKFWRKKLNCWYFPLVSLIMKKQKTIFLLAVYNITINCVKLIASLLDNAPILEDGCIIQKRRAIFYSPQTLL